MISQKVQAIILAAGKSSRLKTGKTKLVEKICGQEMILYPVDVFSRLKLDTTIVIGFQKELVEKTVIRDNARKVTFITQEQQLGTGHAIACTQQTWSKEHILIINGDMPLLTADIIEKLYLRHINSHAMISFITAHNTDPSAEGYGRVIQDDVRTIQIIEAKEFKGDLNEHCCINAGVYLIKRTFLEEHIKDITANKITHEWYITDLIKIASDRHYIIETITAPFDRIRGINTLQELWAAEQVKKSEIIKNWMNHGVRFAIAQNVQIDVNVTIGAGSFIDSGVQLLKNTHIGKHSIISAFSILTDAIVGDHTTINSHTIISNSTVGSYAIVGPFAHVREKSIIHDKAVVGNFVEIKKSSIGKNSKAKHLTYLGDSKVGNNVCIGAGTITCNYDGVQKYKTIIEDNAFIGSNNTIVAPVTIEKNAFTAAGSTITENVPQDALAIARNRQVNKHGYAKKIKRQDEEEIIDEDTIKKNPTIIAAFKSPTPFDEYS